MTVYASPVCFLIAIAFAQTALALHCYTCQTQSPNQTCFTHINTTRIPSKLCNRSSADLSIFFNLEHVNPTYLLEASNSSEFECVSYTKTYLRQNITRVGRGCFPKTPNLNVCQAMFFVQGGDAFNLTQCDTCDQDNCNKSVSIYQSYRLLCAVFLVAHYFFNL
ncbi:hypothetical protein PPYR_12542 [Photinus pyralis]|uniref:Protein sleepless n=2 Tax=Photinus pyralis TaxID=7054 RepID=A0A5N4A6H4_PHOPY|nr:uncharacterized protein LOC116177590 [Photinus pyralis]KAB0792922.1 hypothetical protein PPYR_12542 [Photinus pyralis]